MLPTFMQAQDSPSDAPLSKTYTFKSSKKTKQKRALEYISGQPSGAGINEWGDIKYTLEADCKRGEFTVLVKDVVLAVSSPDGLPHAEAISDFPSFIEAKEARKTELDAEIRVLERIMAPGSGEKITKEVTQKYEKAKVERETVSRQAQGAMIARAALEFKMEELSKYIMGIDTQQ